MTVDRYTKAVLTVIAVCLVWLSIGGPSLITPVGAQDDTRVLLRGWVDETGRAISFPVPPPPSGNRVNPGIKPPPQRSTAPLPTITLP